MKANIAIAISLASLFAAIPALAHHSISADYFMDQRASVEGDVTNFLFRNPHSWLEFKGPDPRTGDVVTWNVEWNGAGRLGRDGLSPETLKPGDHVIVTGQPGRNPDDHRLHMINITRPSDGWQWHNTRRRY